MMTIITFKQTALMHLRLAVHLFAEMKANYITSLLVIFCLMLGFSSTAHAADDHGDAPASYGDPTHTIAGSLKLGPNAPDAEATATQNATATGDNTTGTNDEDGISLPPLTQGGMDYGIGTNRIVATGTGTLHAWMDLDRNGAFTTDEYSAVTVTNGVLSGPVAWYFFTATPGTYYLRFRFTSATLSDNPATTAVDERATMAAPDGEVEDYALVVASLTTDYGDAPESYGAPVHNGVVSTMRLGAVVDTESEPQYDVDAMGDDQGMPDDEDGVSFSVPLVAGATSYTMPLANLSAAGSGTIHAWIDFNKDGAFGANEYATTTVTGGVIASGLNWPSILVGAPGKTFARFRFTSTALTDTAATAAVDERATMAAANGEVEDHVIQINNPSTVQCNLNLTSGLATGATLTNDAYLQSHGIRVYVRNGTTSALIPGNANVISHAGDVDSQVVYQNTNFLSFEFWSRDGLTRQTSNVFSIMTDNMVSSPASAAIRYNIYDTSNTLIETGLRSDGTVIDLSGRPNLHRVDVRRETAPNDTGFDQLGLPYCSDRSDAPASYGSPTHMITPFSMRLGAWINVDKLSISGAGANTDQNDDGVNVSLFPPMTPGATTYSIPETSLTVAGSKTDSARLRAWIDFNRDGKFSANEASDEVKFSSGLMQTPAGVRITSLTWPSIGAGGIGPSGPTYARFRLMNLGAMAAITDDPATTDVDERSFKSVEGVLASLGPWPAYAYTGTTSSTTDGEVEDYLVTIGTPTYDYGDAPATYGAPSHMISGSLKLGATAPDSESAASTPLDGTGDGADEDGVSAFPTLTQGATSYGLSSASISAAGTGRLHVWIDFNKDGVFSQNEYDSVSVTAGTLSGGLAWSGITVGEVGTTYARLRFTSTVLSDDTATTALDERSTMAANDGEVEDYAVTITTVLNADLAVVKTDGVSSVNAGGTTIYTITVTNNGPSASTATLTDPAVTGLTKTAVACGATPGVCATAPTIANLEAGFTTPSIPSGSTYQISVTTTVTATSGSVANTAMVTTPSGTTDPTSSNNSSTDTDTVPSATFPSIGGSTTCTSTGGTDVLFLLDNSGSIDTSEYSTYASTVLTIGNTLRTANPATRIAVAHYAGTLGGLDFGQNIYFERDFSTAALSSPVRQFGFSGAFDSNLAMDNMAGAVYQAAFGLDGNSGTTSSYILGSLKELSRDLTRPLQIVIFTDANREKYGSSIIDGSGYAYEPNDGSNFTIYNLLKAQGVKFSVTALSIENPEAARDPAAAAIASVGGAWTGSVESNPYDPQGSQTTPRRFETSTAFTLSSTQTTNFVNAISSICPAATNDHGDAPATYGDPTHTIAGSLKLGANAPDAESAAATPLDGTGDNVTSTNDEDGVSSFPTLNAGATSYSIPTANITATGTGTLHAWIDFDKNGAFTASEYKFVSVTGGTLAGPLNWTGITVGSSGTTYARLRFTTTTLTDTAGTTTVDERATMAATDGEVEDYAVTIAAAVSGIFSTPGTYTNDYCVTASGATGLMDLGDMPTADVTGAGTFNYTNRTLPGFGTVDVSVTMTGGKHKADTAGIDSGGKQTSWLDEGLPNTGGSAIYLEPSSGGTATLTYNFDQPTGNLDLLVMDVDFEDTVTITAKDGNGAAITDFSGWRYRSGDLSTWQNPDPVAQAPTWNASTATLTSTDDSNDHRSFGLLTPNTLVTQIVIKFTVPAVSGRHVYSSLHTTTAGRDGQTSCPVTAVDHGDAPASYGDASHIITSNLYLGANLPDGEAAAKYSYNARADNNDDGAPSQPVSTYIPLFPTLKITDTSYTLDIKATNNTGKVAKLYGWIDFDKSGTFEADEAATVNVPTGSNNATVTLNWGSIPLDIKLGTVPIRLRLTTDSSVTSSTPTGDASDGEVEDYPIAISMAIPPNSSSISIVSGVTPAACETVLFQDNFDDIAPWTYWGNYHAGSSAIRGWQRAGGGTDTYAVIQQTDSNSSVYFGNGAVREISPPLGASNFTFDSNGKLLTPIDSIALRDDMDDDSFDPTVTTADWGPEPVQLSRTFSTVVGKSYRLYFKGYPERPDTDYYAPGIMRLDMPGGSLHFKTPGSNDGVQQYAVEFTAINTTSTINFVNYGHVELHQNGWCDPNSLDGPWCTVGGSNGSKPSNELIIDDVVLTDPSCTVDHGDAPATYGDPTHTIAGSLKLGANAPDAESAAATPLDGTGDNVTGTNDEDGVSSFPTLNAGATSYTLPAANISATGTGTLHAWIDFDKDGAFSSAEYTSVAVTNGTLAGPLSWTGITAGAAGTAYARLRFTSTTLSDSLVSPAVDERATMAASDGEVEDYAVTIAAALSFDHGDAPASYGDPSHAIVAGLYLGANPPDAETVPASGTTALGDDATGTPDDEDGLLNTPMLAEGSTLYSIPTANIKVVGTGTLHAWVDFNHDGAFTAAEHAAVTVTNGTLSGPLSWTGLTPMTAGATYLRLRLTSGTLTDNSVTTNVDERATMAAPDGEVEDFAATIVTMTCDPAANAAMQISGTATLNNANEIKLTEALTYQAGSAWSKQPMSLASPFSMIFKVYLGTNNNAGADGIAFAFQRAPAGASAVGMYGSALGVGGLDPAVAIEFDTFANSVTYNDIGNDHTVIYDPVYYHTNLGGGGPSSLISSVVDLGNIEDDKWHVVQVNWDPATKQLDYSFDNVRIASVTRDLINTDFGGNPLVYYGFAAATGGYFNDQRACLLGTPTPVALDYSDAPASYGTPSHALLGSLKLGATAPDSELTAQPSIGANGDGADEDGAFFGPATDAVSLQGKTLYKSKAQIIDVKASGTGGKLSVWFDWNKDGDFLDAGEQFATDVKDDGTGSDPTAGDGIIRLLVTPPATATKGVNYVRFRWSTDSNLTSISAAASDGEVEDYTITIAATDYSDGPADGTAAPDGTSTAAYGIAAHTVIAGIQLGTSITEEVSAVLDADNASDDGITLPTLIQGQTATLTATVQGAGGYLQGWIDFNGDGAFGAGEQVATNLQDNGTGDMDNTTGKIAFSVTVPATAITNKTYARFRWSTTKDLTATAVATDGEVEDYGVTVFTPLDLSLTKTASVVAALPGASVSFTLTVSNAGAAPASGVAVTDLLPAGLTYTSASTTNGIYDSATGIWTLASPIAASGTATLTINTTMGSSGATRNRAWISASAVPDPDSDPATGFGVDDLGDGKADDDEAEVTVGRMAATTPVCSPVSSFAEFDGGIPIDGTLAFTSTAQNGETLTVTHAAPTAGNFAAGRPLYIYGDGVNPFIETARGGGIGASTTWSFSTPRTNVFMRVADVLPSEQQSVIGYLGTTPIYPIWYNPINGATFQGQYGEIIYDGDGGTQARADFTFPSAVDKIVVRSVGAGDYVEISMFGCKAADLSLMKTADLTALEIGQPITFTLTVRNVWKYNAPNVKVTDVLPPELTYVASNASQGSYDASTGVWTVGTLAKNGTATLKLTANPTTSGAIKNIATITSSDLPDPDSKVNVGINSDDYGDGVVDDDEAWVTVNVSGYQVSGKVFNDSNVNGTDNSEAGIKEVTIVLEDTVAHTCRSTRTGADGRYTFSGLAANKNYVLYEAASEKVPVPQTCPPAANDPNGYTSSTANSQPLTLTTSSVTGINFGDVRAPSFTLDNEKVILPNTTVAYPHIFQSYADGTVVFSVVDEQADPSDLTWSTTLYVDTNCDAKLDKGDVKLTSAYSVNAGDKVCLLAKVSAPANATSGAVHTLTLQSDFTYGAGATGIANDIQTHTDITKTSAGTTTSPVEGSGKLNLEKTVWNVTRNIDGTVAKPGETLRYTILYENVGNGLLDELAVHDTVPTFTTLVAGSVLCDSTPPELTNCTPTSNASGVEWTFIGKLKAGSKGTVVYDVKVD